ncbi:MAG TPA: septum formation initiator family protein [Terriglobia bacterium]|nr:septum formation initiator family protein [Terriglobia bacterium]
MDIRREFRRRSRQVLWQLLGACIAGYFVYHAVQGDRGVIAWIQVSQRLAQAKSELEKSNSERAMMEQRVALLSNSSLDLDMLEERARIMLNFSHPDDLVILLDPSKTSPADAAKAETGLN